VVADPRVAVRVGRGIADAPIGEILIGVIRADVPDGRAAGLPGVSRPAFMARLARSGNGVEAPDFLASLRIEGDDLATRGAIAARGADDHFVFHDQRGVGDDVAVRGVGDGRVPKLLSVLRVESDNVRVEGSHIQRVAQNGQTAVYASAAGA